jgi:hypothetical protein
MKDKGRYILQVIGMLMLICGYLLSDQPDTLSLMHFNPNPENQVVFQKAVKHLPGSSTHTALTSSNNRSGTTDSPKYIPFEIVLLHSYTFIFHPLSNDIQAISLPENYAYLYFKEINPPPPKVC